MGIILALSALLTCQAMSQPPGQELDLIPDGAVPAFMRDAYRGMSAIGKKYADQTYINTYRELYGHDISLNRRFPSAPDSFIGKLQRSPDDKAEQIARRCLAENCLGRLDGDEFMNKLAMLEAFRHQGLSPEELSESSQFLNDFSPPASYQRWEQARITAAVITLGNNPAFRRNLLQWLPEKDITEDTLQAQYELHRSALQLVSDAIRMAFGLESAQVVLDGFIAFSGGTGLGMTFPPEMTEKLAAGRAVIVIDYSVQRAFLGGDPWNYIDTVAHETKHSVDHALARDLILGRMNNGDIRFPHAAAIVLNGHVLQKDGSSDTQYAERNAGEFGATFTAKLQYMMTPINGTAPNPEP